MAPLTKRFIVNAVLGVIFIAFSSWVDRNHGNNFLWIFLALWLANIAGFVEGAVLPSRGDAKAEART